MGNIGCCAPVDNQKYFDYRDNNEEKEFRLWEKKLGFFRNTFKNVQPLLMLDEVKTTNTEVVKSVLVKNYSEEYSNLLKSPILCEKGVIKNDKLILLVFLSTIHTVNRVDNVLYCDKALFLFSLINKPDEIQANAPIESNNIYIREIIEKLLTLSTIELYKEYSKTQYNTRDDMYNQIEKYKHNIVEMILTEIFNYRGKKMSSISFNEFNALFCSHPNVRKI